MSGQQEAGPSRLLAFINDGAVASTSASALKELNENKKAEKMKNKQGQDSGKEQEEIPSVAAPVEPIYCICEQVSYGGMICCENDLCPMEWFHFPCINLTTTPEGVWYCPNCRGERDDVMKPFAEIVKQLEDYNRAHP